MRGTTRRRAAGLVAAAAMTSLIAGWLSPAAIATPGWPQSGFNGAHTNYNTTEHTLTAAVAKDLNTRWHANRVGGIAVRGKRVFEADAGRIVAVKASNGHRVKAYGIGDKSGTPTTPVFAGDLMITSDAGRLFAMTVSTGKQVWTDTTPDTSTTSYTWNGLTLSGNELFGIERKHTRTRSRTALVALTATTGTQLWRKPGYYGPVAAADGQVYAQHNGTVISPGSHNHTVTAFDAATGAAIWPYPTQLATGQHINDLTVTPTTLLVTSGGSSSGRSIYGLSTSTGVFTWQSTDPKIDGPPRGGAMATDGTTVAYLSGRNDVVALTVATGAFQWRRPGAHAITGAAGVIYVTGSRSTAAGRTVAYRLGNGKRLWTSPRTDTDPDVVAAGRLFTQGLGRGGSHPIYAYGK